MATQTKVSPTISPKSFRKDMTAWQEASDISPWAPHHSCKICDKSLDENAFHDIMTLSSSDVNVTTWHQHSLISRSQKSIENSMSGLVKPITKSDKNVIKMTPTCCKIHNPMTSRTIHNKVINTVRKWPQNIIKNVIKKASENDDQKWSKKTSTVPIEPGEGSLARP